MKPDLIIFDLDGTLIDSIGGIAYSANHVLEKYGFKTHATKDYYQLVGHGVKATIANGVPKDSCDDEQLDEMVEEFTRFYSDNYLVDTKLYEGVEQVLNKLNDMGIPIAINTNKHMRISKHIYKALFSEWDFVGIYGPDDQVTRKPDPMAAKLLLDKAGANSYNSLYIGDSEVDIETATNAKMKSVWVSWGLRDKSILEGRHVDSVVHHPLEILGLLD